MNTHTRQTPGTRPNRILSWLFEKLLPYDPQGVLLDDIEEVYASIVRDRGKLRADFWYLGQIFRSIPASLDNTNYWGLFMLKHYATAAFRSFRRHRLTTSLNLMGLSAAVGATIVMFLFIDLQLNMDRFHENLDDIYLVTYEAQVGDAIEAWGNSPMPLGPVIEESDPAVLHSVRMARAGATLRFEDVVGNESIRFIDPAFFDVFTFPLVSGSSTGFKNGSGVVLSQRIATKYFGADDPTGEEIFLTLSNGRTVGTIVSAVTADIPMASSFGLTVAAPFSMMRDLDVDYSDWSSYVNATVLMLRPGADPTTVEANMASQLQQVASANSERVVTHLGIEAWAEVPTLPVRLNQSPVASMLPVAYIMFGLIALMVLLVACFNYVNIAMATAMQRSKEIGLRKVVGSYRIQLIAQFLGENILLSTGALFLGVFLAEFLFIPWINTTQEGLAFNLNYLDNKLLWGFLLGVLGITGIGAGLYPAVFVSRFQPSQVLRGTLQVTGKKRMTRFMLGTQLVFSFLLLAFGTVLLQNAEHQRSIDWGYDQTNRVVIPFRDSADLRQFESELASNASVIQMASSTEHVGTGAQPTAFIHEGQEYEADQFSVGFGYLETMGIRLNSGRTFKQERGSDRYTSIVVNSKFARQLGIEELDTAVGQFVTMTDEQFEIIGVTNDFHARAFIFGIEPMMFRISERDRHQYLTVQVAEGSHDAMKETIAATWKSQMPDYPFAGFSQESIIDDYFNGLDGSAKIFLFISIVALAIAVMGLFGLVLITVTRRGREIGIRKTMGATDWNIIRVMQGETVRVVFGALLVGTPIAYFAMKVLMQALSNNASSSSGAFVMEAVYLIGPVVLILAATFATSIAGTLRGARMKPVDILRQNAD